MALVQHERENEQRVPRIIGIVAAVTAVLGLVVVTQMTLGSDPLYDVATEARIDDTSVVVQRYEWLEHDHSDHDHGDDDADEGEAQSAINDANDQAAGFAMPASMMPGTPNEGFVRLQIDLNIVNRAAHATEVGPEDFILEADGSSWLSLRGGTFATTTLAAGHGVVTVIAFDVVEEQAGEPMELAWRSGDETIRFAVNGTDHGH